jgi:hypothetical protein
VNATPDVGNQKSGTNTVVSEDPNHVGFHRIRQRGLCRGLDFIKKNTQHLFWLSEDQQNSASDSRFDLPESNRWRDLRLVYGIALNVLSSFIGCRIEFPETSTRRINSHYLHVSALSKPSPPEYIMISDLMLILQYVTPMDIVLLLAVLASGFHLLLVRMPAQPDTALTIFPSALKANYLLAPILLSVLVLKELSLSILWKAPLLYALFNITFVSPRWVKR